MAENSFRSLQQSVHSFKTKSRIDQEDNYEDEQDMFGDENQEEDL